MNAATYTNVNHAGRKEPIRAADYSAPALRVADTRLDCTTIVRYFVVKSRPWHKALAETIDRLLINKDIP